MITRQKIPDRLEYVNVHLKLKYFFKLSVKIGKIIFFNKIMIKLFSTYAIVIKTHFSLTS